MKKNPHIEGLFIIATLLKVGSIYRQTLNDEFQAFS